MTLLTRHELGIRTQKLWRNVTGHPVLSTIYSAFVTLSSGRLQFRTATIFDIDDVRIVEVLWPPDLEDLFGDDVL